MKKTLFAIAASAALFACTSTQLTPEQAAIQKALNLELSYPAQVGSVNTLVLSEETTPLAGCPKEFSAPYKDYIASWKKFAAIEKSMYEQNYDKARADIDTFLKNFLSDPTNAIVTLKNEWPKYSADMDKAFAGIRQSFVELTTIATKYGIALPKKSLF